MYLVSGGFDCLIVPEAKKCGIAPNHVIANTILFDKEGSSSNCTCCDTLFGALVCLIIYTICDLRIGYNLQTQLEMS